MIASISSFSALLFLSESFSHKFFTKDGNFDISPSPELSLDSDSFDSD